MNTIYKAIGEVRNIKTDEIIEGEKTRLLFYVEGENNTEAIENAEAKAANKGTWRSDAYIKVTGVEKMLTANIINLLETHL